MSRSPQDLLLQTSILSTWVGYVSAGLAPAEINRRLTRLYSPEAIRAAFPSGIPVAVR